MIKCYFCERAEGLIRGYGSIASIDNMYDKVNLVISYSVPNNRKMPDLHVTVLGKEYTIPNGKSLSVTTDRGEYNLFFKIPFMIKAAMTDYKIILDCDKLLEIGWNSFWGRIRIKETVTHITL